MPLRTARLIPPGWAEHHMPVAEAAMTARVQLHRPDTDTRNDRAGYDSKRQRTPVPAGTTPPPPVSDMVLIYDGPALVVAQTSQAATADVAGQPITVRTYAVSLPRWAPRPRAGVEGTTPADRITVTASPGDPGLVGARLRVIDVAVASESFARDVIALYELGANNPPLATPGTPPVTGPPGR